MAAARICLVSLQTTCLTPLTEGGEESLSRLAEAVVVLGQTSLPRG